MARDSQWSEACRLWTTDTAIHTMTDDQRDETRKNDEVDSHNRYYSCYITSRTFNQQRVAVLSMKRSRRKRLNSKRQVV